MRHKYSTHFALPHDVEPRRVTKFFEPSVALIIKSLEPSGRRIKIRRFKKFNKLPLEVRRLIWAEAAHLQRVVQFGPEARSIDSFHHALNLSTGQNTFVSFCTEANRVRVSAGGKVPAMLQVNQEARREGLRYYEKPFGEILTNPGSGPYFNFAADMVYFQNPSVGAAFLGSRSYFSPIMVNPCSCSPVSQEFRELIKSKLRHLSVRTLDARFPNPDVRYKLSLGMFVNLYTFTTGNLLSVRTVAAQSNPSTEPLLLWRKDNELVEAWDTMQNKPDIIFLDSTQMNQLLKDPMVKSRAKTAPKKYIKPL
ncbi:hypothetical protein DL95DRAFT_463257 [Leptodontidium sp. 2 PMI_412]|nr:hypothetical protein DL95DRAFT_463257 [Leptodontidium sp. 2 PMI_412]